ncbi:LON peptidase substrate-binding domain-containing protein [Agromyces binzhouensis]|uniref:LON peptidase substrate-binding domain-containing protein n=1 Tax=Agromyces binzhouensis TaxID=1817495 RepID=UPI00363FA47C
MGSFAMFPLGSVLFPHMPLALRVFEPRYLVMMSRILNDQPSEFGVVLIESGREAAGAEAQRRFDVGTVARVTELGATEGDLAVIARGGRRIEVVEWLPDDPHPVAVVRELPELDWDESLGPLLERAELVVRRTIARASEFVELPWDADAELSEDPTAAAWQLAGIAPLTPLDQVRLLASTSLRALLTQLIEFTVGAGEVLTTSWASTDDLDAEIAEALERAGEHRPDAGEDSDGDSDDDEPPSATDGRNA